MSSIASPPSISTLPLIYSDSSRILGLSEPLVLGHHQLHLWIMSIPDTPSPEEVMLQPHHEAWMTDLERARGIRFIFQKDQRQHRLTRALCRWVLSQYTSAPIIHPNEWRFHIAEYGKPSIDQPQKARDLIFNITHTRGLIAMTVSRSFSIHGVDAEMIHRQARLASIAERYFAPTEVIATQQEPEVTLAERFFAYWTLKESYIKADGSGLRIPLDHFAFDLDEGSDIRVMFAPERQDHPSFWHFFRYRFGESYRIAVAIRSPIKMESQNPQNQIVMNAQVIHPYDLRFELKMN